MQAGGTDMIELGMPFSDPIADGPAIQESNTVSNLVQIHGRYNPNELPSPIDCFEKSS